MADEKILKDEILNDEQLDEVAGGSLPQTANDMNYFTANTGMQFFGSESQRRDQFRNILFKCGIKMKDHGSSANEYYLLNAQGKKVQALDELTAMNVAINNYRIGYRIC